MVKLLIRCTTCAFIFVTACVATMILCRGWWLIGMVATSRLLSPGFLLMGAVYRATGGTMRDTMFAYIAALVPGVIVDVAIYTAVFFGLANLARMLVSRAVTSHPTTDDERSETAL